MYKFNPFTKKPDYYETGGGGGGTVNNVNEHRLTLESGVGVSTSDQENKTILYATPYIGDHISLYDGADWAIYTMAESSLKLTTSMSAVAVAGDTSLWVASTTTLFVGMSLTGSNISGLTIASITASNAVKLNASAATDGAASATFKLPSNTVWDVFGYLEGSTPKITFGPVWTDTSTRATAITTKDNIPVLTGTHYVGDTAYSEGKMKLLGTIGTLTTAGQTNFSISKAMVTNIYNVVPKTIISYNTNASWTYNGTSKREYNGGSGQVRAEFVISIANQSIFMIGAAFAQVGLGETFYCALGYDSTTTFAGTSNFAYYIYTVFGPAMAYRTPAIGYHYMTQLEWSNTGATGTNYGQYGGDGTLYSQAHVTVMV